MQLEANPRLPIHPPDIQFGGGLNDGEEYLLTGSEVRIGESLVFLAISVDGKVGPLRHGLWPVRTGRVREDTAFLHDADYLALFLNFFHQLAKKEIPWKKVEALFKEVEAGLESRGIRVMLS